MRTLASYLAIGALAAPIAAEDWPGYERGGDHRNASAVTIAPAELAVRWERRFTDPVRFRKIRDAEGGIDPDMSGQYHSRNLVLVDGHLALVAALGRDAEGERSGPQVTVLDAANGETVNVIEVHLNTGNNAMSGPYPIYQTFNGAETFHGAAMVHWDRETGNLFLAAPGDGPSQTAYRPLANADRYQPGTVQDGVPAFAQLHREHPGLTNACGLTLDAALVPDRGPDPAESWGLDLRWSPYEHRYDETDPRAFILTAPTWNRSSFFAMGANEPLLAFVHSHGHGTTGHVLLTSKHTGAPLRCDFLRLENGEPLQPFLRWGGVLVHDGRLFAAGTAGNEGGGGKFRRNRHPAQGLSLTAYDLAYADEQPDDGAEGAEALDTVLPQQTWRYQRPTLDETGAPIANSRQVEGASHAELDGFYRNKPLIADGTGGCWYAWKPSLAAGVELVHATDDGVTTGALGVGAGRPGWQLWPQIALAETSAGARIAYYHGNQFVRERAEARWIDKHGVEQVRGDGWARELLPPLGPAEFAVADGDGQLLWSINCSARWPSLPANPFWGYLEKSHMLMAGDHAWLAWVDTTGEELQLRLVAFDCTAAEPTVHERAIPLGVASTAAPKSICNGLIAADGVLYAHVLIGDELAIDAPRFDEQRVLALGTPESP